MSGHDAAGWSSDVHQPLLSMQVDGDAADPPGMDNDFLVVDRYGEDLIDKKNSNGSIHIHSRVAANQELPPSAILPVSRSPDEASLKLTASVDDVTSSLRRLSPANAFNGTVNISLEPSRNSMYYEQSETPHPLSHYLTTKSWSSYVFMHLMLLHWNFQEMIREKPCTAIAVAIFYATWILCTVAVVTVMIVYIIYALHSTHGFQFTSSEKILVYLFFCNLLLELTLGCISFIFAVIRLTRRGQLAELNHLESAVRICWYFVGSFMVISMIGCALTYHDYDLGIFIIELGVTLILTISTCAAVVANLFFILGYYQLVCIIRFKLGVLSERESLTVKELTQTRLQMGRLTDSFQWPNIIMGWAALVSMVTFLCAVFIANASSTGKEGAHSLIFSLALILLCVGIIFLSIGWYCKEIIYLFIVLFKAAQLNQLADKLSYEIGTHIWATTELEITRFQVVAHLQVVPISFRFLGTRPTYKTVLYQIGSVCVAVFISVVKVLSGF
jgi:hypothetical protein